MSDLFHLNKGRERKKKKGKKRIMLNATKIIFN